jgi:hypothetical protein
MSRRRHQSLRDALVLCEQCTAMRSRSVESCFCGCETTVPLVDELVVIPILRREPVADEQLTLLEVAAA